MTQYSIAARNGVLSGIIAAIGASPKIEMRSGLAPADPANAASGTQLATGTLPSSPFGTPSAASVAKAGTWSATGVAGGYIGHYRILSNDGATCHAQGPVSEPWAASKAYVVAQQVHNGGNVYRATAAGTSASSGGPTGTGTGITDGTVTWAYVGPVEMTIDNSNVAISQVVTINAYTLNA
ncbi:hypothetical protein [Sphingomonas sp.]|uniref:hypothetical protein n=1 Tax=Sphingomonadales TaxID=204457 RepID=UPI0035C7B445